MKQLPILITRGVNVFPSWTSDVNVGRSISVSAIDYARSIDPQYGSNKQPLILVTSQINLEDDEIKTGSQFYKSACLATIVDIQQINDPNDQDKTKKYSIKLQGEARVLLDEQTLHFDEQYNTFLAEYVKIKTIGLTNKDNLEAQDDLIYGINKLSEIYKQKTGVAPVDEKQLEQLKKLSGDFERLIDLAALYLDISPDLASDLLRERNIPKRFKLLNDEMTKMFKQLQKEDEQNKQVSSETSKKIDNDINKKINDDLNKQQREFYLREKLKAIKSELNDGEEDSIESIKEKVLSNPYPEHIKKRILSEINKLESTQQMQEASIIRTYIEWLANLPWWQKTQDKEDIQNVEDVLNKNHYGLNKAKERILEYLAVAGRAKKSKAPIICLVGPPGVGKTSLAFSIAEALGRKSVKVSLGGVRDEAEIRGHRRTYLGAMPGRIINGMRKAEVINPVFILDEIDKMSNDYRGDPASAMLEVLDPEQNTRFSDNYIEEEYDLSNVMFIATANYVEQIPEALYDRMEIIELTSYTENEKLSIAKNYLIPKTLENYNLSNEQLSFNDDAIKYIINHYTREAGVRELERLIQRIARKFVVRMDKKEITSQVINVQAVKDYLKKEIFDYTKKDEQSIPGVVNGMAYTSAGGDLLPIEVSYSKGKGDVTITGNLKETMNESAKVALGFVKAHAEKYHLDPEIFSKIDLHIHVPSGGVPKDGPSAGVTLTTALLSALKNCPVSSTISMTGEITLRGQVGIIGGVKEKTISAFRGGVNEIFMPKDDEKYLDDVPEEIKSQITFHFVSVYDDIYNIIFTKFDQEHFSNINNNTQEQVSSSQTTH